jgi:hypothetical protein
VKIPYLQGAESKRTTASLRWQQPQGVTLPYCKHTFMGGWATAPVLRVSDVGNILGERSRVTKRGIAPGRRKTMESKGPRKKRYSFFSLYKRPKGESVCVCHVSSVTGWGDDDMTSWCMTRAKVTLDAKGSNWTGKET